MRTNLTIRSDIFSAETINGMSKMLGYKFDTSEKTSLMKGETITSLPEGNAEIAITPNEEEEFLVNMGGVAEFAFPMVDLIKLLKMNGYTIFKPGAI